MLNLNGKTGKLITLPDSSFLLKSIGKEIQRRNSKSREFPLQLSFNITPPYSQEDQNVHQ